MFFFDETNRTNYRPESLKGLSSERIDQEIKDYISLPPKEREQTDVPPVWKYKLEPDILGALRRMSYDRCAFCEREDQRLSVYRFRPPARAYENKGGMPIVDKGSYIWLAWDWLNFFPICNDCLPEDKNYFPVRGPREILKDWQRTSDVFVPGDDQAVFYAPGEIEYPHRFFDINLNGEFKPLNRRASETIRQFRLNRSNIVEERQSFLNGCLEFLEHPEFNFNVNAALEFGMLASGDWRNSHLAGTKYLLLRKVGHTLNQRLGTNHRLTVGWVEMSLLKQKDHPDFPQAFENLSRDLRETPPTSSKPSPAVSIAPETQILARVKSIRVENFKSLENISIRMPETIDVQRDRWYSISETSGEIPEAPCLLILGENATGKSSILEAFTLACIPETERHELDLSPAKVTLNPHYMGAGIDTEPRASAKVHVELYGTDEPGDVFDMTVTAAPPKIEVATTAKHHPMIFAYGAHRLFGTSAREGEVTSHIDTLFRDDRQIANPEPWLIKLWETNQDALDGVVQALRHIIRIDGEFQNITVVEEKTGTKHCVINVRKQGAMKESGEQREYIVPQYLSIASSGYRAVLAVICDILKGLMQATDGDVYRARRSRAIVLIDEIEAHLHPRWKLELITGLRKALPQTTFLLTSHDPLCMRGMLNGEVRLLNRFQTGKTPDEGLPEVVEQVEDFGPIETLTIEQILVSDFFQLYSTDDRSTDQTLAQAAEILMRERAAKIKEEELAAAENRSPNPLPALPTYEQEIVNRLNNEIAESLPDGRTEVSLLVQEAVAEFLVERRNSDFVSTGRVRERAKREVKDFLKSLL